MSPERPSLKKQTFVRRLRRASLGILAVTAAAGLGTQSLHAAEKVLRVAMTAADIPINIGQPDQGFEGFRFMGYMLYDTLVLWDLSKDKESAKLVPGLAESWTVDPKKQQALGLQAAQGREIP